MDTPAVAGAILASEGGLFDIVRWECAHRAHSEEVQRRCVSSPAARGRLGGARIAPRVMRAASVHASGREPDRRDKMGQSWDSAGSGKVEPRERVDRSCPAVPPVPAPRREGASWTSGARAGLRAWPRPRTAARRRPTRFLFFSCCLQEARIWTARLQVSQQTGFWQGRARPFRARRGTPHRTGDEAEMSPRCHRG